MAKSKRAAALFEVIHSGREEKSSILRAPRWWFPHRAKREQNIAPIIAAPIAAPVEAPASEAEPAPQRAATEPLSPGMNVEVDPQTSQITLKLSYNSVLIIGFTLIVAVTLSYLVGRKLTKVPPLAIATQSSQQLRAGPAHPEVLNLSPRDASRAEASPHESEVGSSSSLPSDTINAPAESAPGQSTTGPRSVNLNYVVIQSYPDEKSATDACDALTKAGVPCTIERGLRGLKADWFTVVGTQGFTRVSSDDFKNYIAKIDAVSAQFAKGKRSFRAFQPMPYKWDKTG